MDSTCPISPLDVSSSKNSPAAATEAFGRAELPVGGLDGEQQIPRMTRNPLRAYEEPMSLLFLSALPRLKRPCRAKQSRVAWRPGESTNALLNAEGHLQTACDTPPSHGAGVAWPADKPKIEHRSDRRASPRTRAAAERHHFGDLKLGVSRAP